MYLPTHKLFGFRYINFFLTFRHKKSVGTVKLIIMLRLSTACIL